MTRSTSLRLLLGVGLAALYIVVAATTTSWAPGETRPLFDGFGSHPGQYGWVNPPREFAEGNRPPDDATAEIVFAAGASSPAKAESRDGQVLAGLDEGSVAAHPPDTAARIVATPLDSAKLGPLPPGLRAEGNAYRVQVVHLPSQAPATGLTKAGTLGLTSAAPADTMLFSPDGARWQTSPAEPVAQGNGLVGPLAETGYFVTASRGEPRGSSTPDGGRLVLLYAAAGLVPLVLGYLILGRRGLSSGSRRGSTATGRRSGPPPRRPASGPPAKRPKRR